MRRYLEDAESIALMDWARLTRYGSGMVSDVLYHTPNGGKRNAREAARLKAMGVRAGVPDYFCHVVKLMPETCTPIGGMYLELKAMGGTLTDKQQEQLVHLASCGYHTAVAYGWQEAARKIADYLGLRQKIADAAAARLLDGLAGKTSCGSLR